MYGLDTFNTAKSSLDNFWGGFQRTRREFLFFAINYVGACFSDSLNASLFLQSLIIHLFALSGMKRYMGIAPPMVLDVDVLALLLRNNAEYDGTRHSLRNPVLASKIP